MSNEVKINPRRRESQLKLLKHSLCVVLAMLWIITMDGLIQGQHGLHRTTHLMFAPFIMTPYMLFDDKDHDLYELPWLDVFTKLGKKCMMCALCGMMAFCYLVAALIIMYPFILVFEWLNPAWAYHR